MKKIKVYKVTHSNHQCAISYFFWGGSYCIKRAIVNFPKNRV